MKIILPRWPKQMEIEIPLKPTTKTNFGLGNNEQRFGTAKDDPEDLKVKTGDDGDTRTNIRTLFGTNNFEQESNLRSGIRDVAVRFGTDIKVGNRDGDKTGNVNDLKQLLVKASGNKDLTVTPTYLWSL